MTHVAVPDPEQEVRDQIEFDRSVDRAGNTAMRWLAAAGIFAAVAMSATALAKSGQASSSAGMAAMGAQQAVLKPAGSTKTVSQPQIAAARTVSLSVIGSYKLASDGKKHDAFTTTEFAVKVGQPLKLAINNTDNVPHSITSPQANVSIVAMPGKHTYTLIVTKAGKFLWFCAYPCDTDSGGWAMSHPGYMSGYITAT